MTPNGPLKRLDHKRGELLPIPCPGRRCENRRFPLQFLWVNTMLSLDFFLLALPLSLQDHCIRENNNMLILLKECQCHTKKYVLAPRTANLNMFRFWSVCSTSFVVIAVKFPSSSTLASLLFSRSKSTIVSCQYAR